MNARNERKNTFHEERKESMAERLRALIKCRHIGVSLDIDDYCTASLFFGQVYL